MYRYSFYLVVFTILFLLLAIPASAKPVSYVKEYAYQAGEMDSKLSCRTIALEQVKRLLLEELGTYIISETVVTDFKLTKDQISCFTAGLVKTVIIDEQWDGKTFVLTAKISVDTDELIRSIDNIRKDHEQSKTLEDLRKKNEGALNKIEKLNKEIKTGGVGKAQEEKYAKVLNELNAIDWFKKGYALRYDKQSNRYNDKINQEAMKAFDKAIELDPNFARAYAARAALYNDREHYGQGLRESEQAVKLDPDLAWGFNTRGWAHIGLRHFQKGIEDLNRATELDPTSPWPYCNRSLAYYRLNKYDRALEEANKAIELSNELSIAYFHRGKALAGLTNYDGAIKSFDKAIELNPMFSGSFLQRGYALLKLGKNEQGLEDIKHAANLGNNVARDYLKEKSVQW